MQRSIGSWLRHLRLPTLVALVTICTSTSSCNGREFPTSQASAAVRPTRATTGPFYSDLGNGWANIMTLGGPTAPAGSASDIKAVRLSAAVGHAAAHEFGTIRSKYAKTCRATLPDGQRVEAVLSSDDTAGLAGQSAMSRMSLSVNGITRYTIEYSSRKEGERWAVYAARYTIHDDSGRRVAHGLLRQSNGRLVSAAQTSTPPTVADATKIVPRFNLGVAPPRLSFDVTSDIASIWCLPQLSAQLATAAIAAGAAATWFTTMNTTATAASTAAAVLAACIVAHTPIIYTVDSGGGGYSEGGDLTCEEWEVGFYDDYGNWWTLDSFQTCSRVY